LGKRGDASEMTARFAGRAGKSAALGKVTYPGVFEAGQLFGYCLATKRGLG
jgi:hypothetical protein